MVETPWCYMPPEMHFDNPNELKHAFLNFLLSRRQDELNDARMRNLFLPPNNKFEKVKCKNGRYILIPTTIDYSFLFRGQTSFYEECLPTLYRKKEITEEEILIERLRCCEFELYLKQYPQVADFEQNKFNIDYLGLSQHYGLKTDVIDLTSSLDVALFFAMCNMSKDGKTFYPQQEDKDYIGYIYAIRTMELCSGTKINNLFEGKICTIGMQPFYRPGNQRGFGLHLQKKETMTGLLYSFSYSKEDSEKIYNAFSNGNELWHEDEISSTAMEIKNTTIFSYNTMLLAFKRYYKYSHKKQMEMKQRIISMGYTFQKHSLWELDKNRLNELRKVYIYQGGFTGINDIVQRTMMDKEGHKKTCVNTELLSNEQMFRFPISGCKAPDGYNSPYTFYEDKDRHIWGHSETIITQEKQTKPNPYTQKVDKWSGDWKTLPINFNREKTLRMKVVNVQ